MSSPFQTSDVLRVSGGPTYAVRFVRTFQSYYPGDVATFPQDMARRLVAARRAEPVNVIPDGPVPEGGIFAMRYPITKDEPE